MRRSVTPVTSIMTNAPVVACTGLPISYAGFTRPTGHAECVAAGLRGEEGSQERAGSDHSMAEERRYCGQRGSGGRSGPCCGGHSEGERSGT